MVHAVLFDLDDTLFDHAHCSRAALAGVRDAHPCFQSIEKEVLERSHASILEELHLEVLAGRVNLDAARVERFRRLYAMAGVEAPLELAQRTAVRYREAYVSARTEVSGAATLLGAIHPHARVVIVSNNVLAEQQEKLRQCGLDRFVDDLVVSEDVGVSKPDPRIFEVALERAGCAASTAVMIGDAWKNDIEGARAAGIRAIWFNRDGAAPPDPGVPVIRSLEPVEPVLTLIFGGPPTTSRA